jgi:hypothetical protein
LTPAMPSKHSRIILSSDSDGEPIQKSRKVKGVTGRRRPGRSSSEAVEGKKVGVKGKGKQRVVVNKAEEQGESETSGGEEAAAPPLKQKADLEEGGLKGPPMSSSRSETREPSMGREGTLVRL